MSNNISKGTGVEIQSLNLDTFSIENHLNLNPHKSHWVYPELDLPKGFIDCTGSANWAQVGMQLHARMNPKWMWFTDSDCSKPRSSFAMDISIGNDIRSY